MLLTRYLAGMICVGIMVLNVGGVSGQTASTGSGPAYPNKPIRIVAVGSPGGGTDFVARLIVPGLTGTLGQQIIVDNRPSLSAIETVAKSPPDGYNLLLTGNNFWTAPLLQKMPYDPERDFSPITFAASSPNILVVHPSLPVKSIKELIALAKIRPGELTH